MSDDTNIPIDPDMTPEPDPRDVPTEPMEDPSRPGEPFDVSDHSLADPRIGGTLGDAKNQ